METRGWNGTKSAFADDASASTRGGDPIHSEATVRSYAEIYLHFVWGTWDRHPLLTGDRVETVYRAIHHECASLDADVIAIGGMEDHVHLLNPEHGTRAPFRWQRGYGVFSVSRQHVPRIRNYVLNQEAHHREGRTAPYLEPVFLPNDKLRP